MHFFSKDKGAVRAVALPDARYETPKAFWTPIACHLMPLHSPHDTRAFHAFTTISRHLNGISEGFEWESEGLGSGMNGEARIGLRFGDARKGMSGWTRGIGILETRQHQLYLFAFETR